METSLHEKPDQFDLPTIKLDPFFFQPQIKLNNLRGLTTEIISEHKVLDFIFSLFSISLGKDDMLLVKRIDRTALPMWLSTPKWTGITYKESMSTQRDAVIVSFGPRLLFYDITSNACYWLPGASMTNAKCCFGSLIFWVVIWVSIQGMQRGGPANWIALCMYPCMNIWVLETI